MAIAVDWLAAANRDRARIVATIRIVDPRAADRVGIEIVKQARRLSEFPMLGRMGRVAGTRELSIARTPYILIYRETAGPRIEVLRILHARQNWPPSD